MQLSMHQFVTFGDPNSQSEIKKAEYGNIVAFIQFDSTFGACSPPCTNLSHFIRKQFSKVTAHLVHAALHAPICHILESNSPELW
jgi:hypothetical protein